MREHHTAALHPAQATDELARDQAARRMAVDPRQSFIVQAPAGSGKTELLVQRMLALLATVDDPAQILAITFTRKAAQEMRERLIGALEQAAAPPDPAASPLAQARRAMALPVLARDEVLQWRLREQPDRLLIDTFDAFCGRVVARSQFSRVAGEGALGTVTDQADVLYLEAATRALAAAEIADAVGEVLTIAGNQVDAVIALISNLLARRAQWLGAAVDVSPPAITALTATLRTAAEAALQRLDAQLRTLRAAPVAALAAFTADMGEREGAHARLAATVSDRRALAAAWPLPATLAALPHWHTLSAMLLTGDSGQRSWRKGTGVNKSAGFPKHDDKAFADVDPALRLERKAQMVALLDSLQDEQELAACFDQLDHVPTLAALAEHEAALRATLLLLRRAAAELLVLQRERGVTDFSGVMSAALAALRENRADVLANFDATLAHVLVDEVQDTNPAQFELLDCLTAEWSAGDGRTLFLVGDPMQSIYLFRDADVSLFRRAQRAGVGGVALTPLTLTANYRSQPAVVAWVNHTLGPAFGRGSRGLFADGDPVPFVAAMATRAGGDDEGQSAIDAATATGEALAVADAVAWRQRHQPGDSVAVLARTRGDAAAVIDALRARGIAFNANEFARWSARELVRDLLNLTYAVAAPWDRLALYAVLRSPWVGLRLATLAQYSAALAARAAGTAGASAGFDWQVLAGAWTAALPEDERARVARAHAALQVGQARAWLSGVAARVEAVWHALAGPALLPDAAGHQDAGEFFQWLDAMAPGGLLPPRRQLLLALAQKRQSFAHQGSRERANAKPVELLTIHKAKGLEWDHVFLIGCDRAPRPDTRSLAAWRFQALPGMADADGREPHHVRTYAFAARDTRKSEAGSVYDFLARFNRASRLDESKRQLYVAVTRARKTLTLSRQAAHREPPFASFSYWLGVGAAADVTAPDTAESASRRLHLAASLTRGPVPAALPPESIEWPAYRADAASASLDVPLAERQARAAGVVGHLLFEGLGHALRGGQPFAPTAASVAQALLEAGAPDDAQTLGPAAARLATWFAAAPSRPGVRFLFDPTHRARAHEVGITAAEDDACTVAGARLRVDYTFIAADGARWIVDFKFAEPATTEPQSSAQLEAWLAGQAAQYAAQLEAYRRAFAGRDGAARPIITALYFPWLDRLYRCD